MGRSVVTELPVYRRVELKAKVRSSGLFDAPRGPAAPRLVRVSVLSVAPGPTTSGPVKELSGPKSSRRR